MFDLPDLVESCQQSLDDRATEALYVRGMTDHQIETYRIGYSSDPLPLPGLGMVPDCHVFPLTNALGQIRGIQVRPVRRSQKVYKDFFAPGSDAEPVMFGLGEAIPHAWAKGYCWLVEGVHDLSPIQRACQPTIATLKAGATPPLLRLLHRLGVVVYMGWDNDKTGHRARYLFRQQVKVPSIDVSYPAVSFTDGTKVKDPGDLWELWGTRRVSDFVTKLIGSQEPLCQ